jgi:alkaline phosphatase D
MRIPLYLAFLAALLAVLVIAIATLASVTPIGPGIAAHVSADSSPRMTHGPIVDGVTSSSAIIWARTDVTATVSINYGTSPNLTGGIVVTDTNPTAWDSDFTKKITLTDLSPNQQYYYNVLVDGVSQLNASPLPTFKTFPLEGTPTPFKVVYLTDFCCFGPDYTVTPPPVDTFMNAANEHPDLIFIGGDFDHRDPAGDSYDDAVTQKRDMFKDLYTPKTNWTNFLDLFKSYPVAHQWDDHDSGRNDDAKNYPFYNASKRVLSEYFPTYDLPPDTEAYGDWQKFTYGNADFFVLDARSQRDPPTYTPTPPDQKSMLDGNDLIQQNKGQLYWLEQGLAASEAAGRTWKFILSPVVFNTTMTKPDSWYGYSDEHDDLVTYINNNHIHNVIVLSGDIHAGGIDNGDNAHLPEMAVPAANLKLDRGATPTLDLPYARYFCFSSGDSPGTWSEGTYPSSTPTAPCPGYGVISVSTNPDQVRLQVKDEYATPQVDYVLTAVP